MFVPVVTWSGRIPGLLGQRELNGLIAAALETMGRHWHRRFLERHFTAEGARLYGYQPRSGQTGRETRNFWTSYSGRKQRKFGHQRPNVLTGYSLMRARIEDVVATSKKATVKLHAPALSFHNRHSPIYPLDEIRAKTPEEMVEITRVGRDRFMGRMGEVMTSKVAWA